MAALGDEVRQSLIDDLTLSDRDRVDKLKALCVEFLSQVAKYGFGPDDVVQAIRGLNAEE